MEEEETREEARRRTGLCRSSGMRCFEQDRVARRVRAAQRSGPVGTEGDLLHSETGKSLGEQPSLRNDVCGSQIGVG